MVLGEADRIVAEVLGQPRLGAHFGQHARGEILAQPGHAGFDLGSAADRRQIEKGDLHRCVPSLFRWPDRQSLPPRATTRTRSLRGGFRNCKPGAGGTPPLVAYPVRTHPLPCGIPDADASPSLRSEEHTSELQSLMRISYAVFCLKK